MGWCGMEHRWICRSDGADRVESGVGYPILSCQACFPDRDVNAGGGYVPFSEDWGYSLCLDGPNGQNMGRGIRVKKKGKKKDC